MTIPATLEVVRSGRIEVKLNWAANFGGIEASQSPFRSEICLTRYDVQLRDVIVSYLILRFC
jgi:hypothetical protein